MIKIAILGATSHIAKGLIYEFSNKRDYEIVPFVRNKKKLELFIKENGIDYYGEIFEISEFGNLNYDVVINCIGVGTPNGYNDLEENILELNEKHDNKILEYIKKNPKTKYIYLSSGAIYGKEYFEPINVNTKLTVDVNNIVESDFYLISKLYTETKHRALSHLNIIDIRVFSYFSRFIDLDARYLVTDMIKAVQKNKTFETNKNDIVRDYVGAEDLVQMIEKIMEKDKINDWFDLYSLKPIKKSELIDLFVGELGMKVAYLDNSNAITVTGNKSEYYSLNRKAEEVLGYIPNYSSFDIIGRSVLNYNIKGNSNE